jgi:hypothetical protein
MRVVRRRGHAHINLEGVEASLLETLFDDLDGALSGLPDDDPVRQRLFPAAYPSDDRAAAEFRSLTEQSLREDKEQRLGACRADLPAGGGTIDLDDESARRWLTVVNDLRLAIGTRLNITEEDEPAIDPSDPDAQVRAIYQWLTMLQDALVHAIMKS